MDCIHPIDCWKCGTCVCKTDGVRSPRLVFSYAEAQEYYIALGLPYLVTQQIIENNRLSLACGKCDSCIIRKRKDMTVRISHEVACHDECCFVTLTYNDDNIPVSHPDHGRKVLELTRGDSTRGDDGLYTLVPSDVQKFIKRLRRHLEYVPKNHTLTRDHVEKPIRYFLVGEYGSKTHRPHYHILIFGWRPSDQYVLQAHDNYTINRSPQIEKLWKFGFSTVADVNFGVARYCARYVTKKLCSSVGNELYPYVVPEFTLQSTRRGGIGSLWVEKYPSNLRHGYVNVRCGEDRIAKCSIPRYYFDRLRKINLPLWLEIRDERMDYINSHKKHSDFEKTFRQLEIEYRKIDYSFKKEQL